MKVMIEELLKSPDTEKWLTLSYEKGDKSIVFSVGEENHYVSKERFIEFVKNLNHLARTINLLNDEK